MNEQISLTYHQAQAVAERAAKVRNIALRHKGYGYNERTRVTVAIYNPYYTEKKPELHGLYLAVEGSGSAPVPLFAKDLGYARNFEVARLGMRDENGHIQHPDMDGIGWDEFDMGPQLRALGWVSTTVSFESDAGDAAQARYDEGNSPDCSYWTPTRPEGAGWLLAAIYDTEDGPVALFVRDAAAGVTRLDPVPAADSFDGITGRPHASGVPEVDDGGPYNGLEPLPAGVSRTDDQTFSHQTPPMPKEQP